MFLHIGPTQIPYRISPTRGQRISLGFSPHEPVLIIRTPNGKLTAKERAFIRTKERWLLRHYERLQTAWSRRQAFLVQLTAGEVPYLGRPHRLVILPSDRRWVQVGEGEIRIESPVAADPKTHQALVHASLRTLAEAYLVRRTQEWATQTGSSLNQIRVKAHRSKWGSCSVKRNINLNWHLIFLPPALIDYLIVHELMHLREMNHSPRYWKWVETFYPDYRQADRALASYHWLIGIFDA